MVRIRWHKMQPNEMKSNFRESQGELVNHWYILALENEVPEGKPIQRWAFGIPYVLFRDENKNVTVLEDRCPHRGAMLSEGTCHKGQIKCPYHGWEFNTSGEVTNIPSEGAEFKSRGWKTNQLISYRKDNCIWIWCGNSEPDIPAPSWSFPNTSNPNAYNYFMTTDFDNQVGPLVQNFMDVPHTVFVHSKWFRDRSLIKVPVNIQVSEGRVKVTYLQPQDSIGFMESILNPKKKPMIHTDEFIFPNITRVDYNFGEYYFVINSQCTPTSEFTTRVFTWISYYVGMPTHIMSSFMRYYTRKVIQQDVQIMKNHVQHLKVFENNKYLSTGADEHHVAIEKMIQTGMQNKSEVTKMNFQRDREFWI